MLNKYFNTVLNTEQMAIYRPRQLVYKINFIFIVVRNLRRYFWVDVWYFNFQESLHFLTRTTPVLCVLELIKILRTFNLLLYLLSSNTIYKDFALKLDFKRLYPCVTIYVITNNPNNTPITYLVVVSIKTYFCHCN